MIILFTSTGHTAAAKALTDGSFGFGLPQVRVMEYEDAFQSRALPSATYIFADIERLASWEQRAASLLYRLLGQAGLRRLNNPARVMARFELLRALRRNGTNPFDVYWAMARPRPQRFPVFVRFENNHGRPGELLPDQAALDRELDRQVRTGTPLRSLIVTEYCGEPAHDGIWIKRGSFRLGQRFHLDHYVAQDEWRVKYGRADMAYGPGVKEAILQAEYDEVVANLVPAPVRSAFAVGGVEYGRADHATVGGREVIYEINTNPHIKPRETFPSAIRNESKAVAHARLAELFWEVDSGDGGATSVAPATQLRVERFIRRDGSSDVLRS